MADFPPGGLLSFDEQLREDIAQNLLFLSAPMLIAVGKYRGLDADNISVRQLIMELSAMLANEGFVPVESGFDDSPDRIEVAPVGTVLN